MLKEDVVLRSFQEEGCTKMEERGALLLALVMGAGKTVTSIAAAERLMEEGEIERVLVVVPSMLKYQWQREIHRFTDQCALVIDGTPQRRAVLYKAAEFYRYTMVSYNYVINDWDFVKRMKFDCVILDEATYIKGFTARRSKAVKGLGRKKTIKAKFALTGQPIENMPEDLFSIMEFVDPSVLGTHEDFERTFIVRDHSGKVVNYRNLPLLNNIMSEAMYRKTRADIKDELPDVIEEVLDVDLSRPEARLYNIIKDRCLMTMYEAMESFGRSFNLDAHYGITHDNQAMRKVQGDIMAMLLALRHICDDPQLLLTSALQYKDRKMVKNPVNGEAIPDPKGHGSEFAALLLDEGLLDNLPKSTKMRELRVLLQELLLEEGTKVVVFSGFKENLHTMRRMTADLSRSVAYTGDMNSRAKDKAKLQFQRDPTTRLFFSSDAGGYGVDLKEANYLISFDLPWSAGKRDQRDSRIIRLSSEFDHVTLLSMVVRGSIERRIYDMLQSKSGVASAFLDGAFDKRGRFTITLGSLTKFLQESSV